jgi:preprotein translocase subunit YajC
MEIISQLLPFVFLIAIMYFVIIRPQQKEAKAKQAMIGALAKGDKVVTNGGFIVTINKVEENFLSVKMNSDVIAQITKDSIAKKYEDVISKSESLGKA